MNLSSKSIIIGVDIGGTKIRAGAVNHNGEIIGAPVTVDTVGSDESEKIFGRISDSIAEVIKNSGYKTLEISGIGMGVTGPLDTVEGTILECPQLPTMNFYPLREKIREKFNLPVIMDNDANALLLGESIFGAGKGYRTVLGYTLGTGLGCAIIINNRIFTGANGMAGEIWPSPHKDATIEDIVSGRGVSAIFQNMTGQQKTSKRSRHWQEKGIKAQ
jgi:glucokinase